MRALRSPSKGAARGRRTPGSAGFPIVGPAPPCWSSCAGSSSSDCSPSRTTWPSRRFRSGSSIRRARSSTPAVTFRRAQQVFLHNGLMEYGSAFGHGAYLGPPSKGASAWPENAGVCWFPEDGSRPLSWSSCAGSSSSGCWPTARTWPTRRSRSESSIRRAASSTPAGTSRRASRSSCTTGSWSTGRRSATARISGPTSPPTTCAAPRISSGAPTAEPPRTRPGARRSRTSAPTATTSRRRR